MLAWEFLLLLFGMTIYLRLWENGREGKRSLEDEEMGSESLMV